MISGNDYAFIEGFLYTNQDVKKQCHVWAYLECLWFHIGRPIINYGRVKSLLDENVVVLSHFGALFSDPKSILVEATESGFCVEQSIVRFTTEFHQNQFSINVSKHKTLDFQLTFTLINFSKINCDKR